MKYLTKLESVGAWLDESTMMVYPDGVGSTVMVDDGVPLWECEEDDDWSLALSPLDKKKCNVKRRDTI